MPTKKPRYFDVLRAEMLPGESLDQGTPRILGELRGLRACAVARGAATLSLRVRELEGALADQQQAIAARDAEIVELRADVASWRAEVEAVANRGVVLVGAAEAEARAADERVAKRLGEHRMARDAAERALHTAEGQIDSALRRLEKAEAAAEIERARVDELAPRLQAATDAKVDAIADATLLRETAKRQAIAHAAELDAATSYARLVGGLIGVTIGVLVTVLVVAAL